MFVCRFFFFKQKTAYEMRISDWSSDVCSSDLMEAAELDDLAIEVQIHDLRRRVGREVQHHGKRLRNRMRHRTLQRRKEFAPVLRRAQIGRASCRERVCPYV